ncbi:BTB domain-containing protein [Mycena sanguinolenta]|uniref:BTB domain-containing protein n=1 Tax=Mycena sanguinolenta TaxID=230812 RepID=A0A8H6YTX8_9AGAR|nr:BTB domain-containing protein [Mycena sanguinolenta]
MVERELECNAAFLRNLKFGSASAIADPVAANKVVKFKVTILPSQDTRYNTTPEILDKVVKFNNATVLTSKGTKYAQSGNKLSPTHQLLDCIMTFASESGFSLDSLNSAIVNLSVEGTQYRVDRFFLDRDSPVLREMFSRPMEIAVDEEPVWILSDVTKEEFENLLWIYYNPFY